jgi:PadR family transcriptional regulator, regulatory protein PadR
VEDLQSRIERALIGGALHLIILAEISRRGPIHGYGLIRALVEAIGRPESFQEGKIYPIINELERANFVRSHWGAGDAGPQRKYYELTPNGRAALRSGQTTWERLRAGVDSILERGRD